MPEIDLHPSWTWVETPWGRAIQCRAMAGLATHLFTTREPALATGDGSDDGWARLAGVLGVPCDALVRLRQVHGRDVLVVGDERPFPPASGSWGLADAVITRSPHLALSIRVADCVPILMADRESGAVAAVHAGWRGIRAGVAPAAVDALGAAFGTRPADLVAALGPSIGPCCYRVGAEVAAAFREEPRWRPRVGRWLSDQPIRPASRGIPGSDPGATDRPSQFLDAWTANADQLAMVGVPRGQIFVSGLCTSCHRDVFHSYRVDGPRAGRMVAVIRSTDRDPGPAAGDPYGP